MQYFLMHEDKKIALVELDNFNNITNVALSSDEETCKHLPLSVFDENSLVCWLKNRGIPVTRDGISKELKLANITDTFALMLKNNGLSLTDHYWLNERGSDKTWDSINLYTNPFKSSYSLDLKDDIASIADRTNFIPSASLHGDLKKKWIIDFGVRRLVKGNYGNTCRQSLCEVLATQMHYLQNKIVYTPYNLIYIASDGQCIIGCECPNFTSITTEFIPAIDIVNMYKKPNELSYYEFFIKICLRHGLDIRSFLEYQIMTDFIISNSDRHLNNFGILRDSRTLEWLSYAPLFDSGNSMFYKSSYIPVDKALLKLEVTSFLSKEVNLLKYVTNRGLVNALRLPDDSFVYALLKKDINTKDEVNERLLKAYKRKIEYLQDFQNGADIWSYNYKG